MVAVTKHQSHCPVHHSAVSYEAALNAPRFLGEAWGPPHSQQCLHLPCCLSVQCMPKQKGSGNRPAERREGPVRQ